MEKIFVYYNTKNNYYRYKLVNNYYHNIPINSKNQYDEILIKVVSLRTFTSLENRIKNLPKIHRSNKIKNKKRLKFKIWVENSNTINLQT